MVPKRGKGEPQRAYRTRVTYAHFANIQAVLTANPDGMTAKALAQFMGMTLGTMYRKLQTCPGIYIDRWERRNPGRWAAVYCLGDYPDSPLPYKYERN